MCLITLAVMKTPSQLHIQEWLATYSTIGQGMDSDDQWILVSDSDTSENMADGWLFVRDSDTVNDSGASDRDQDANAEWDALADLPCDQDDNAVSEWGWSAECIRCGKQTIWNSFGGFCSLCCRNRSLGMRQ